MPKRAWTTIAILWIAYVFSLVDRQALSLMLEPIRVDLGVSDTAMGFLHGATFAAFYGLAGLPIAYAIDRGSRRVVVSAGFLAWSLATAACGMARDFFTMFVGRIGVAAGEACLIPSANSIIADLFAPVRRGRATGAFASAIPVGFGIALFGVGLTYDWASSLDLRLPLLGKLAAWQIVFLSLGGIGCVLAGLPLLISEPVRRVRNDEHESGADLRTYLRSNRRLMCFFMTAVGLFAMAGYATLAWFPTLLVRVYGWSIQDVGIALGAAVTVPGIVGTIGGGHFADRLVSGGQADGKLRACVAVTTLSLVPLSLVAMVPTGVWASVALAAFAVCAGAFWTVAPAAIQDVTPPSLTGRLTAGYGAVVNLIGIGLGPLLVGLASDSVFDGQRAIELALVTVATSAAAVSAFLFFLILQPYRDLAAAENPAIADFEKCAQTKPT